MSDAHVFADREDAAERYLLGQMSESDRDAYEQHFFQCVQCAEEVKATARFIDSCRSVLTDPAVGAGLSSPRPARRLWFAPSTAAILTGALAATLALVVYQNVVTIPKLRNATAPQALKSVSLAASNSRGTGLTITVPREQPYLMYVDIPPGPYDGYDLTFVANDGRSIKTATIPAALTHEAVPLMMSAGRLTPGEYTLVVSGRPRVAGEASVDVARFSFTLRFAD